VPLPIGESAEVQPGFKDIDLDGVKVELVAGLAARHSGRWNIERAGWFVLCNGRVVVSADKTDLTGWGSYGPQFVDKFRGFVGIAFFFSDAPAKLPWTTTKRGLNQEAEVFQLARKEMMLLARPVLSFLGKMYAAEADEETRERQLADDVKPIDIRAVAADTPRAFTVQPSNLRQPRTTVQVQFPAAIADVDRIKKRINQPSMTAGAVGRHALEYFLKMECAE
jgi:hypothetical protein